MRVFYRGPIDKAARLIADSGSKDMECEVVMAVGDGGVSRIDPLAEREIAQLHVKLKAPLDMQEIHESLNLSLQDSNPEKTQSRLRVPISWAVVPAIELVPSRLYLGSCEPGLALAKSLLLRSGDNSAFRITRVTCAAEGVLTSSKFSPDSSTSHALQLNLHLPDRQGIWLGELTVETDYAEAPSITMPISALIGAATDSGRASR